jgi:hypothetical protein
VLPVAARRWVLAGNNATYFLDDYLDFLFFIWMDLLWPST